MVLEAAVPKQVSKQSFSKVSSEVAARRCSSKWVFLKISQRQNTCVGLFFNKVEEETPTQVFSCEYCKIFKVSL